MKVELFGKQGCAVCQTAKNKISHFLQKWGCADKVAVEFVDMETVDGLAEGAFRDVVEVPTTIVTCKGKTVARWDKTVPSVDDFRKAVDGCLSLQSK